MRKSRVRIFSVSVDQAGSPARLSLPDSPASTFCNPAPSSSAPDRSVSNVRSEAPFTDSDVSWLAAVRAAVQAFRAVAAERVRQRRVYQQTMRELRSLSPREINELGLDPSLFEHWAREKARARPGRIA